MKLHSEIKKDISELESRSVERNVSMTQSEKLP